MNLISKDLEKRAKDVETSITVVENIQITNQVSYGNAGDQLKILKTHYKDLITERKKITVPQDLAKKAVMDFFKKPLDILEQAGNIINAKMLEYNQKIEKKRAEEQRKAEAEAREKERKKQEQLEREAKAAERKGDKELAEQRREEKKEVYVPPKEIKTPEAKAEGSSTAKIWKYKVVNFKALPDEWKIENEKALGSIAKSTKGTMNIPGVEFYQETIIKTRT